MSGDEGEELELGTLDDDDDYLKILYYGVGGTGKTTDVAAMARLGPVVYVDAAAGLKRRALDKMGIPTSNILPYRNITNAGLEELFWSVKASLEEDDPPIGVSLDLLGEMQKMLLEFIAAKAYDKTVAKAERSGQETDRTEFDIYKEDWGVNTEQMRRLIRKFRDLECHTAFVCLPRRDQDDDGTVTYGPAVSPALQADLIGYVDLGCATRVREVAGEPEFYGTFRPHGAWWGKDRFHALPKELVDPTFDRVLAYVREELTVETDPIMQESAERHRIQAQRDDALRAEKAARATQKATGAIKKAAPRRVAD